MTRHDVWLTLMLLPLLCTSGPAHAGGRWAACADAQGGVHVVEARQVDGTVTYRAWNGREWSAPSVVWTGFVPFNPALAADLQGNVHLVWGDAAGAMDNADLFHVVLKDGAWSEPEDITQALGWEWGPSLAILPNGDMHLTWQSAQGVFTANNQERGIHVTGINPCLWHRVCRNGEWSLPSPIVQQQNTFGYLSVDSKGGLHIVYVVGPIPPQAGIRVAHYEGDGWGASEAVNGVAGVSGVTPPLVAADGAGGLHVLYAPLGIPKACYCRKIGDQWEGPSQMGTMLAGSNSAALLTGPDGSIHLAYPEEAGPGRSRLAYTRYKDGQWTPPVTAIPEGAQEIAMVIDSQGNPHIIWGSPNRFGHVYSKGGQWVVGAQE
ncbi:MAG: exo-alpha-sialidase [Armatimonadetes bacterium]|nr:exo-alpha-sialidase [Armatimonadota bacterium]